MPTEAVLVYLGLGGNLGDVRAQFESARQVLSLHSAIICLRSSPDYLSTPWGGGVVDVSSQADYLNQVLEIKTTLPVTQLLSICQKIERGAGRDHQAEPWSARTLDIDILLYEQQQLRSSVLEIPHPRMLQRAFVLKPLADLSPYMLIPGSGRVIDALGRLSAKERDSTQQVLASPVHPEDAC